MSIQDENGHPLDLSECAQVTVDFIDDSAGGNIIRSPGELSNPEMGLVECVLPIECREGRWYFQANVLQSNNQQVVSGIGSFIVVNGIPQKI